jgi:hypothetical protein
VEKLFRRRVPQSCGDVSSNSAFDGGKRSLAVRLYDELGYGMHAHAEPLLAVKVYHVDIHGSVADLDK